MSDLSFSPSPEPKNRKRKSKSTGTTQANKKPRGRAKKAPPPDPYGPAKAYMESVLASPGVFDIPEDDDAIRDMITTIVHYAKSLEGSVAVANRTGGGAPALKTADQVEEEAARIRKLINRGIKKLMCWKPTCADGRAKYAFEGVCPDSRIFGAVFGLGVLPVWVNKKFTSAGFGEFVGDVRGEVRDVKVEYNHETGEFTVSGKYGKQK